MEFSVTQRYSKSVLPLIKKYQDRRIKKIELENGLAKKSELCDEPADILPKNPFLSFLSIPFLSRGMSIPSTSHQCPDFLSLPARNLAPDYSYSRLIHNQGSNRLIKKWNSLLPSENSIALTILNDLRMLLAFKEDQLTTTTIMEKGQSAF
ncbi:hypothetical protein KY285_036102 [Solanum tuberosum]|nr:hypothetical protein KY289_036265 [Solanum tuberosum]KAH0639516.1 hypothetical protein KY285_036102 [Solanum tuberosum]